MSRKSKPIRKESNLDPVHKSKLIGRIINKILLRGKKGKAEDIVYGSLKILGERTKENPLEILDQCMNNVKPLLEVKPRRVGGATYQVPIEVSSERASTLAIRWLVGFARNRKEKTMKERLASEILDGASNTGNSVKKKEDLHKMADANKAFAHYRW